MGYTSVSFDPDSIASTSDAASSALVAAAAASDVASSAAAAAAKGSDASSKIAARSAVWDKASAASSVALDALNLLKLLNPAPNDIINPEFAIAQEGAIITAASTPANNDDTYVLDQWILLSDGNDIADITRASAAPPTGSKYNIKVEIETANKKVGIFQPIENQNALKYTGDYASLSFYLKGDVDNIRVAVLSWSSTADTITSDIVSAWAVEGTNPTWATNWTCENTPANIAPTGSWVKHEIEGISIDTASMANLGVFFWLDDTDAAVDEYFEIGQVKLELNSICTKFIPLSIEAEIGRCERYFCKSHNIDYAPTSADAPGWYDQIVGVNITDGSTHPVAIEFNRMRANPTITLYRYDTGASGYILLDTVPKAASVQSTRVGDRIIRVIRNDSGVTWAAQAWMAVHWTADARL